MKITFKIFSVLLIIAAAAQIIIGALLISGSEKLYEFAAEVGISVGQVGAAGMIISLIGAIIIAFGGFQLYTGICGIRGRIEKCRKCTFWILILVAGDFILSIVKNLKTTSAVLWLLFFGVYYLLAKMYMKYDNTY